MEALGSQLEEAQKLLEEARRNREKIMHNIMRSGKLGEGALAPLLEEGTPYSFNCNQRSRTSDQML